MVDEPRMDEYKKRWVRDVWRSKRIGKVDEWKRNELVNDWINCLTERWIGRIAHVFVTIATALFRNTNNTAHCQISDERNRNALWEAPLKAPMITQAHTSTHREKFSLEKV